MPTTESLKREFSSATAGDANTAGDAINYRSTTSFDVAKPAPMQKKTLLFSVMAVMNVSTRVLQQGRTWLVDGASKSGSVRGHLEPRR